MTKVTEPGIAFQERGEGASHPLSRKFSLARAKGWTGWESPLLRQLQGSAWLLPGKGSPAFPLEAAELVKQSQLGDFRERPTWVLGPQLAFLFV